MRGSVNAPAPGGVRPGVAPADDLDGVEGKNLPNVSVVVPVLNAVETIEPCVRAILSQDYPRARFEALFTDNGSTDGTLQVLHGLKDGIVVLNEQRLGSSAARNRGTKAAKHDLIAFTDADCIPEPNWLRNLVAGAQAHSGVDFFGGKILASDPSSRIQRYSERLFDQDAAINRFTPRYAITANLLARKQG